MGFLQTILGLIAVIIGVALGGYILLFGRRALWATLGIIGLVVAANLLAKLVLGLESSWELINQQIWWALATAVAFGALGVFLARAQSALAVLVIGFIAGADIALWLYDIAYFVIAEVAQLREGIAIVVGILLLLLGGWGGLWLVRNYKDEGLILITTLIGTELLFLALGFSGSSSWTAVVLLSLSLTGVVVQYTDYQRELKAKAPLGTLLTEKLQARLGD